MRPGNEGDFGFVIKSWVGSFWHGHWSYTFSRTVPPRIRACICDTYSMRHAQTVSNILKHATVTIAAFDESPDLIWGFVCSERRYGVPILHYVYVRPAYRGVGVGTGLVEEAMKAESNGAEPEYWYTHRTKRWADLKRTVPYTWRYMPYYACAFREGRDIDTIVART